MKRFMAIVLMVLLVAAVAIADVGALAEEDRAVWGIVYHNEFYTQEEYEALDDHAREQLGFVDVPYPVGVDRERMVYINVRPYGSVWFLLPEGAPAARTYWGKGVRVTCDALGETEGTVVLAEAEAIELMGEVVYGEIFEIGKDYVKIRPMYEDRAYPEYLTLNEASDLEFATMIVGYTADFVYDADEVVLYAAESNG